MNSRVVVLGGCGAWPEPGRACNGFLLEHDGFRVALDLGYGTLPRLLALLGSTTAAGLDAVVATHDHPDHVVDLHGLFRARLYDGQHLPRISLYAPAAVLERLAGLEDGERSLVDATDRYQHAGRPPNAQPPMNLTAREAGEAARAARAHTLMLTHFWPGNDRDRSRTAAAEAFPGEILIADEGAVVDLP
jgi:ribonuclease BN (tRNA processing enzyme)